MSPQSPHRRLERSLTLRARLAAILADGRSHTTRELARRVGHTFASAKYWLVRQGAHITTERDPRRAYGYHYRLRQPLRLGLRSRNE